MTNQDILCQKEVRVDKDLELGSRKSASCVAIGRWRPCAMFWKPKGRVLPPGEHSLFTNAMDSLARASRPMRYFW